jgi:hypothetical protein
MILTFGIHFPKKFLTSFKIHYIYIKIFFYTFLFYKYKVINQTNMSKVLMLIAAVGFLVCSAGALHTLNKAKDGKATAADLDNGRNFAIAGTVLATALLVWKAARVMEEKFPSEYSKVGSMF